MEDIQSQNENAGGLLNDSHDLSHLDDLEHGKSKKPHSEVINTEIKALSEFLRREFPRCFPMPMIVQGDQKRPVFSHKDLSDQQCWDKWNALGIQKVTETNALSICLRDRLMILDVDDHKWCDWFEQEFPESKTTVCCATKKGKHFYFLRNKQTDETGLFDGARQLKECSTENCIEGLQYDDGVILPIDIKTVCKTGTGGLITIPPSPHKSWVRSLLEHKVLEPSDKLVKWLSSKRSWKPKNTKVSHDGHFQFIDCPTECADRNTIDMDVLKKHVVANLSDHRSNNYNDWLLVCFAILNVCRDNDHIRKGANMVHAFSKRCSEKYDTEKIDDWLSTWKYRDNGVGLGYLLSCLKEDNYVAFKAVMKKLNQKTRNDLGMTGYQFIDDKQDQIEQLIADMYIECMNHDKVARLFKLYKDNIVYAGDDVFYEKNEYGLYALMDSATQKAYISNLVKKTVVKPIDEYYPIIRASIREQYKESNDEKLKKVLNEYAKTHTRMMYSLGTVGFISGVYDTLKEKYLVLDLYNKLDDDRMLVGFPNGVLDLRNMELRKAKDDEYVSLCMGVELLKQPSDIVPDDFADAKAFMNEILYEPEANWLIMYFASMLQGGNWMQFILNLIGSGANGKSAIMNAIVAVYGTYYYKMTQQMFRDADQTAEKPDPAKLDKKGKRVAYLNETSDSLVVNSSTVKNEGEDHKESGRNLYSKTVREFTTQYKPVIASNNELKFNDTLDWGSVRRLKAIRFPFAFIDPSNEKYDANNPTHKPLVAEDIIQARLKAMLPQICMMLVYHYPLYKQQGLKDTENIKLATMKYIESIDEVAAIINENIEREPNGKAWVSDLFAVYQNEVEGKLTRKTMDRRTFISKLNKLQFTVTKETKRIGGRKNDYYIEGYRNVVQEDNYNFRDDYN